MSGLSEIKIPWLSLDQAAEPLALLLGLKTFTANEVLDLFTNNQVMASVCIKSPHLFAWPLVKLIGKDAEQFRQDEQRTETYRGSSFTIKGECMAPNREDTRLVSGRVLDLPLSTATRNFLQRLQDNPVPAGKRLRLPRGTLVQVPDTGQYFVTMDTLEVPDVFCEIVVRTESLRELERQIKALEIKPLAPPVVAVSAPGGVGPLMTCESKHNAATGPVFSMTRRAMIDQHEHEWPNIARNLKGAKNNGLSAAKAGERGWNEAAALAWARANNELKSAAKPTDSLTQAMHNMRSLPSRKNRLEG